MVIWNDTDIPIGHLLTFRTYGTWLHGDLRGSIDRFHNRYGAPYLSPSQVRQTHDRRLLKGQPLLLDATQRQSVESAVRGVCEHRNWVLHALNVRTNHVHLVLNIGSGNPGRAMNDLKAYATRRMRRDGLWREPQSPWAEEASDTYGMNGVSP